MLTLELFISWLISQGREATNLLDVMAEFDKANELFNYCQNSQPYVIKLREKLTGQTVAVDRAELFNNWA